MPQGVLHGESARQRRAAQKTAISAMGIGPPRLSRSAGGCGLSHTFAKSGITE